ncbi:hypothetical protein VNI00_003184 [Paramarasmius palmivorus]|uniref:Ubiquitinyl hydrolase 1 n=1 Tax=Paramarasmius palmivorus TaxID=297713 RepID=A0AAW0DPA8_9AGAR
MGQKRKRRASPTTGGLATGEVLKRDRLAGGATSWGWVGTEVQDASQITREHLQAAYGLSSRSQHRRCPNKYFQQEPRCSVDPALKIVNGELEEDIIVISDDEESSQCNKKDCKQNPFCLNHLGQDKWEDGDKAGKLWLKTAKLGRIPTEDSREPGMPVGLKVDSSIHHILSRIAQFQNRILVLPATPMPRSKFGLGILLSAKVSTVARQSMDQKRNSWLESPIFQLQVTFAALQESIQQAFNPTKLVESLQLRTAEQQDAQEFSKLFMSHLDSEFKKQPNPRLKSLITDHFEGTQVYGTVCDRCNYKSERSSNFLELEISFKNKARLEDCIDVFLQPEHLTGDNQYLCTQCDGLQDATRYTELRELPPVLHFSLLRFVYDLKTMERKKSKNIISFPTRLDMRRFVIQANHGANSSDERPPEDMYELRGILLHKGSSAYHGHYEAQVYDGDKGAWFQFNDDVVTRISKLGDVKEAKVASEKPVIVKRAKKRRIEDSEEEAEGTSTPIGAGDNANIISSKDAYMLIYVKKSFENSTSGTSQCKPPTRALDVIKDLNRVHQDACADYQQKEAECLKSFQDLRKNMLDIYRHWETSGDEEDMVFVSRRSLENWLAIEAKSGPDLHQDEMQCEHGQLDYRKAKEIKCLRKDSYEKILQTRGSFVASYSLDNLCQTCIAAEFKERLYQVEHPRLVNLFNELLENGSDGVGYWIPKSWLRDWTLQKPKMHQPSMSDPPPDSPDFDDIHCEHGGLSLNQNNRRRISVEACELLTSLFPEWKPVSVDEEPCSICDVLLYERKHSNLERRKRAEDEKAKLKRMFEYACDQGTFFSFESVPNAIVPSSFIRQWRQWLGKPTEYERPARVDNSVFLCEHELLSLDPNCPSDLDHDVTIIKLSEWDILESLYPAGPLIALERSTDQEQQFICSIPVCQECRQRRKIDWETTDLIVRIRGGKANSSKRAQTYANRQSRRLRQKGENRRVTVTKSTTVKDIKIMLQDILNIPTICQRLFYREQELQDSSMTVGSLNLFANDILEFQEQNEVHELSDTDEDVNRPQDEGRAFSGTLLGSSSNYFS